jgi:hypothetical protein
MRRLIAITQLSLDGVMQSPGGWAMIFDDDLVPKHMKKLMAGKFDLLLGRRTYDIWVGYWPHHVDNFTGKATELPGPVGDQQFTNEGVGMGRLVRSMYECRVGPSGSLARNSKHVVQ